MVVAAVAAAYSSWKLEKKMVRMCDVEGRVGHSPGRAYHLLLFGELLPVIFKLIGVASFVSCEPHL